MEESNVVHVTPVNDLIAHEIDHDGLCVCGPATERVETDEGDAWVYVHASLDGRELHEARS